MIYSRRIALAAVLLACTVQLHAQAKASAAEHTLFASVNHERQVQGLPELRWDESLARAARSHAQRMAKEGSISHQFSGEASLPARVTKAGAHFISLEENVDSAETADMAHQAFMHSPGHRGNILDADVNSNGIGVVRSRGQLFVVEDFSKAR
jgi:uncharacterized protein YkwD